MMRYFVVLFFPILLVAAPAPAEPNEFIRLKKTVAGKTTALEIAITKYESKKVKVDLVGVIHVGDASYYKELNTRLAGYDVVLYELVASPGVRPKKNESSLLPRVMSVVLDLESQLGSIDYDKKNFVHADMSFEEMMRVAEKRGDTGLTLGLSIVVDMMKLKRKKIPDIDLFQAIDDPNALKRSIAEQMAGNIELGATLKRLLVDDRNKKVCDVLDREIAAGKKSIAIFYGAAHNADFDKRLRRGRKMVYVGQEWLTAWGKLDERSTPLELRLIRLFK